MCVCAVPGGEPCPAAAVAIAKAEAGETEQREFSPDWPADTETHNYHQWQKWLWLCYVMIFYMEERGHKQRRKYLISDGHNGACLQRSEH